MARLFIEGFEAGHLGGLGYADASASIVDAQAGPPAFNVAGHAIHITSGYFYVSADWLTTVYVSFRWYASSGGNVSQTLLKLSGQLALSTDAAGCLEVTDYDSNVTDTGYDIEDEREYRIGVKFIGKYWADGEIAVYVDGHEVYSVSGVQTMTASTRGINQIRFDSDEYYDDIIIDDAEMPGDTHVGVVLPNADGAFKNWAASSGGDHYADVDDITPSMTDYWSKDHPGHVATVGLESVSSDTKQVKAVQVHLWGEKDGAPTLTTSARPIIYTGGQYYRGDVGELSSGTASATTRNLPTHCWGTNPATGNNWTIAEVNALQVGAMSEYDDGPGPVNGLYQWLAADQIEGATNGSNFGGTGSGPWYDLSGNGLDADRSSVSALRPSYHTNVQNSLPALYFDGSESLRVYYYSKELNETDCTVIVVAKPDTAATTYDYYLDIPDLYPVDTQRIIFCSSINDSGRSGIYDGSWRNMGANQNSWGIWTFHCSEADGATLYIDGDEKGTSPFNRKKWGGIGCIGSNHDADGGFYSGYIGEIIVFSRALNSTELGNLHSYLGAKWDISV